MKFSQKNFGVFFYASQCSSNDTGKSNREFRVTLPWELLYADVLVVIAETEDDLI